MARRPEVFVRSLSMAEGRKLQKTSRRAKDPVKLRRASVVLMSGQGRAVRGITALMQVIDDYVRDVIHAFNERGFDALNPVPADRPRRPVRRHHPRQASRRLQDSDLKRYQQERARERSRLFVAATRARDELMVSWHGRPSEFLVEKIGSVLSRDQVMRVQQSSTQLDRRHPSSPGRNRSQSLRDAVPLASVGSGSGTFGSPRPGAEIDATPFGA